MFSHRAIVENVRPPRCRLLDVIWVLSESPLVSRTLLGDSKDHDDWFWKISLSVHPTIGANDKPDVTDWIQSAVFANTRTPADDCKWAECSWRTVCLFSCWTGQYSRIIMSGVLCFVLLPGRAYNGWSRCHRCPLSSWRAEVALPSPNCACNKSRVLMSLSENWQNRSMQPS